MAEGEQIESSLTVAEKFAVVDAPKETFKITLVDIPIVKAGINYAGYVKIQHLDGTARFVYLPGHRSYDPAGLTDGVAQAAER